MRSASATPSRWRFVATTLYRTVSLRMVNGVIAVGRGVQFCARRWPWSGGATQAQSKMRPATANVSTSRVSLASVPPSVGTARRGQMCSCYSGLYTMGSSYAEDKLAADVSQIS